MQATRDRLARLLNAVTTPAGLLQIESCIQRVIGMQAGVLAAKPAPKPTVKPPTSLTFERTPPWEMAIKKCDSILDALDDLPDEAEEFADSIRDKTQSIRDWIENHSEVTDKQLAALENMQEGVGRWQRN